MKNSLKIGSILVVMLMMGLRVEAGMSPGATCLANSDCASNKCLNGYCSYMPLGGGCYAGMSSFCDQGGVCVSGESGGDWVCQKSTPGSKCSLEGYCSSGLECIRDKWTCMTKVGETCNVNSDCSSGNCANKVCTYPSAGSACESDAVCTSGSCVNGRCAKSSIGDSCMASPDCTSGNCVSGQCMTAKTGSACISNADCTSAHCLDNVCVTQAVSDAAAKVIADKLAAEKAVADAQAKAIADKAAADAKAKQEAEAAIPSTVSRFNGIANIADVTDFVKANAGKKIWVDNCAFNGNCPAANTPDSTVTPIQGSTISITNKQYANPVVASALHVFDKSGNNILSSHMWYNVTLPANVALAVYGNDDALGQLYAKTPEKQLVANKLAQTAADAQAAAADKAVADAKVAADKAKADAKAAQDKAEADKAAADKAVADAKAATNATAIADKIAADAKASTAQAVASKSAAVAKAATDAKVKATTKLEKAKAAAIKVKTANELAKKKTIAKAKNKKGK